VTAFHCIRRACALPAPEVIAVERKGT
jgi:hypothetical protein